MNFKEKILEGIPDYLPNPYKRNDKLNHAPKRRDILSKDEKILAVSNALRYFKPEFHEILAKEFLEELKEYGHIYMYRYKPDYEIKARHIDEFPHKSKKAAAIMLMISNNLDNIVAQHPDELITYGSNGSVFQNWAQYRLTMKYLAEMTDEQTLVLYSGHPLGLFPSSNNSPRVVITNGMVIPNYSKQEDWEKFYALGVSQYGQMTAGSFMYIGPQGIVHGTTITIMNAARLRFPNNPSLKGKLFVSSGLGGMSGAQAKAGKIAGAVTVIAEVNYKAIELRHSQGWVQEIYSNLDDLLKRIKQAKSEGLAISIAYYGNIVDLWEALVNSDIDVELGSDQTSLHNPFMGGYYPVSISFEKANELMSSNQEEFRKLVKESLIRQVNAINKLSERGMFFWDYGNAFMLEAKRANADILNEDGKFKYPSYVENIMGPLCFDYGFGPFRWICTSCDPKDLEITDRIAANVLEKILKESPERIQQQLKDNLHWIKSAKENNLVVGSQARILYANCQARIEIAKEFNKAIKKGIISAPIVLGRDHHDVSGTDSPYRETANIYDGSAFTADMAIHNVIGDSFRGATWVSIHNGGGVGWGEVINGGFGLFIDGSEEAEKNIESMLFWDVNNGIARRSWARNENAIFTIQEEMKKEKNLKVTLPNIVNKKILNNLL
ncbi:MAG: urocanate hydratase [Candidatus Sericytochromatia bacterium]|nr:MAG: urocanate hydratase [Candidatus Sericytochromatia bacterium]